MVDCFAGIEKVEGSNPVIARISSDFLLVLKFPLFLVEKNSLEILPVRQKLKAELRNFSFLFSECIECSEYLFHAFDVVSNVCR